MRYEYEQDYYRLAGMNDVWEIVSQVTVPPSLDVFKRGLDHIRATRPATSRIAYAESIVRTYQQIPFPR